MARDLPVFGYDYDLARWSTGERDQDGSLIWNESLPANRDWPSVQYVTLDLDPNGEGMYRNYHIHPDRPLDVFGTRDQLGPDEPYFDLDDLAGEAFSNYGFEL